MKCETCEEAFPDETAKVYRGKKVCPSCFQALVASSAAPAGSPAPAESRTEHKFVITTVCPECNAELHIHTARCPHCGALVQFRGAKRFGLILLGLFGLMMLIGSIGVSIEKRDPTNLLVGLPLAGGCIGLAVWGYRRTYARKDSRKD